MVRRGTIKADDPGERRIVLRSEQGDGDPPDSLFCRVSPSLTESNYLARFLLTHEGASRR